MNYLEQILEATKAHNSGVRRTRQNVQMITGVYQARKAAEAAKAAALAAQQTAPAPGGLQKNPHSMGDGHGHTSAAEVKGLNAEFNANLQRFIKDSGGKISIGSGYRSYDEQAVLYDRWKRGVKGQAKAAPPGKSNHNHGLAADLKYADDAARAWAHANAAKYGLRFPMSYEPWHIEPINAKALRGGK